MSNRLHIICGMCGSDDMLSFEINPTGGCGDDGVEYPAVFVSCKNCSSLTDLVEIIPKRDWR